MDLEFRRPSPALFEAFERFRDAFLPSDEDMWTGLFGDARTKLPAYLDWLERSAQDRNPGLVPMDTYWVFCGEEMVGELNVRHYLRGPLLLRGGHIAYSVEPKFRGRGIAREMLQYGLRRLKELGEIEALITCLEGNAASARVAESSGGVRIHDAEVAGETHRRYLVRL